MPTSSLHIPRCLSTPFPLLMHVLQSKSKGTNFAEKAEKGEKRAAASSKKTKKENATITFSCHPVRRHFQLKSRGSKRRAREHRNNVLGCCSAACNVHHRRLKPGYRHAVCSSAAPLSVEVKQSYAHSTHISPWPRIY